MSSALTQTLLDQVNQIEALTASKDVQIEFLKNRISTVEKLTADLSNLFGKQTAVCKELLDKYRQEGNDLIFTRLALQSIPEYASKVDWDFVGSLMQPPVSGKEAIIQDLEIIKRYLEEDASESQDTQLEATDSTACTNGPEKATSSTASAGEDVSSPTS